jgi:hypothetical protein
MLLSSSISLPSIVIALASPFPFDTHIVGVLGCSDRLQANLFFLSFCLCLFDSLNLILEVKCVIMFNCSCIL